MALPFRSVENFTRTEELLNSTLGNEALRHILEREGPVTLPIFLQMHLVSNRELVADPTCPFCLIRKEKEILVFDRQGGPIDAVSLSELGLEPEQYEFDYFIGASPIRAWVGLRSRVRKTADGHSFRLDGVVEIRLDSTGVEGVVHQVGHYGCAAVDTEREKCYLIDNDYRPHKTEIRTYDLKAATVESTATITGFHNPFYFVDYDDDDKLLLSGGKWDEKPAVVVFDLGTGEAMEAGAGTRARWGGDGYAYFTRGSTQLWRWREGNPDPGPVYLLTKYPREGPVFRRGIWVGRDRNFLAFYYSVPSFISGRRSGLVLFDLAEKEYRDIPKGTFK